MKSPNYNIACESAFVFTNALTSCSIDLLFEIWQEYNEDLVDSMTIFLRKLLMQPDSAIH